MQKKILLPIIVVLIHLSAAAADDTATVDSTASNRLIEAVYRNDYDTLIPLLIRAGANPLAADTQGDTWLLHALRNTKDPERGEKIRAMIESITDADTKRDLVNHRNNNGESPISTALSHSRHSELAEIIMPCLIEAGADPLIMNEDGYTYLTDILYRSMHTVGVDAVGETIRLIQGIDNTATRARLVNTPLQREDRIYTPLSLAIESDEAKDIVEELLAAGADPFADETQGEQTLNDALHEGNRAVVEMILTSMVEQFEDKPLRTKAKGLAHIARLIRHRLSTPIEFTSDRHGDPERVRMSRILKKKLLEIQNTLKDMKLHDGAAAAASQPAQDKA